MADVLLSGINKIPKLRGIENYHEWKLAVENYLLLRGCLGIVNGEEKEPYRKVIDGVPSVARGVRAGSVQPSSLETEDGKELKDKEVDRWSDWRKREQLAQGVICSTVNTGTLIDLRPLRSARDMWDFLLSDLQLDTEEHQVEIERKLRNLMLKEDASAKEMDDHLTKYNELYLEAVDASCEFALGSNANAARARWFLDTLPADFKVMRSLYIGSDTSKKNWKELRRLYQVEVADRSRLAERAQEINALRIEDKPKDKKERRKKKPISLSGEGWEKKAKCFKCDKVGHIKRDCPEAGGDGGDKKDKGRQKGSKQQHGASQASESRIDSDFWVSFVGDTTPSSMSHLFLVDSGASAHCTPYRSLLSDYRVLDSPIRFGVASKNTGMLAVGLGDIVTTLPSGRKVKFKDVYYIPELHQSILSAGVLEDRGWTISLKNNRMIRESETLKLARTGNLRYVELGHQGSISSLGEASTSRMEREHMRLGHLGITKVTKLAEAGLLRYTADELKADNFKLSDCTACHTRKTVRIPKTQESPRGARDCEMIHTDITGPFTPSPTGNEYILVLYEDFSKVNAIIPMKDKKLVLPHVQLFFNKLETQLGKRVRFIRSDGGGEFNSTAAIGWYGAKGIIHQMTPRHTPELNGVAERFIRTAKDMIASMLHSAKIGHEYWDHAARYASTLLMKTSTGRDGLNPWFKLTGRDPSLDKLMMFGELAFVQIPSDVRENKARLDLEKGELCRIVGQQENRSGWLVRTELDGKLVWSRDVKPATGEEPRSPQATQERAKAKPKEKQRERAPSPEQQVEMREDTDGEMARPADPHREVAVEKQPLVTENGEAEGASPAKPAEDNPVPVVEQPMETLVDAEGTQEADAHRDLIPPPLSPQEDEPRRSGRLAEKPTRRYALEVIEDRWYGESARDAYLASELVMMAEVNSNGVPRTAREALIGKDGNLWLQAMEKEIENIESKGTWIETIVPEGRKPIDSRWVFAIKTDADGKVIKYKARVVARGFSQQPGIDYEETYAPVSRLASLRLFLTVVATMDLEMRQGDVEGAYLNSRLEETLYMAYPDGMARKPGCNALLLKGSLYGLKQSARVWWQDLGEALKSLGFKRLEADWGLYLANTKRHGRILVLAYVDDILVASEATEGIEEVFRMMRGLWTITEIGEVSQILGLKVKRDRQARTIHLSQPAYIETVLSQFPEQARYRSSVPYATNRDGSVEANGNDVGGTDKPYRSVIGRLMWISGATRPDISYITGYLSQFNASPTTNGWNQAMRVVAYLGRTKAYGLLLGGKGHSEALMGWTDADYAGCAVTRRSTTGYAFQALGSTIQWTSKRQATVAQSTLEAEYIAAAEGAREAVYLRGLLREMFIWSGNLPVTINCDNQSAIRLAENPGIHQRSKHIEVRHHYLRDQVENGVLVIKYVSTDAQKADIFTKPLGKTKFEWCRTELGVVDA